MKLDPRIIEGKRPLSCFDVEEAKQFIEKEGYFANSIDEFCNLNDVIDGKLFDVDDSTNIPFDCIDAVSDNYYYSFFLPAAWVQNTEEQEQFARDSLKLAGELHFILHSQCYIGRDSISDDDLKKIREIMAKRSHEEERFLRDVFDKLLDYTKEN